ncbi:hypothetical protein [Herbidospora yilanensis]|uniref:hypothetical protein n=1 Tax=Herbidospora yilanensis TaxID=354426 RepID=UPI0007810424|nr:hypothetical protein [Herbidospora yilanensis]
MNKKRIGLIASSGLATVLLAAAPCAAASASAPPALTCHAVAKEGATRYAYDDKLKFWMRDSGTTWETGQTLPPSHKNWEGQWIEAIIRKNFRKVLGGVGAFYDAFYETQDPIPSGQYKGDWSIFRDSEITWTDCK